MRANFTCSTRQKRWRVVVLVVSLSLILMSTLAYCVDWNRARDSFKVQIVNQFNSLTEKGRFLEAGLLAEFSAGLFSEDPLFQQLRVIARELRRRISGEYAEGFVCGPIDD
jgi:hypothetical protein